MNRKLYALLLAIFAINTVRYLTYVVEDSVSIYVLSMLGFNILGTIICSIHIFSSAQKKNVS
ncbi:hypothetical protein [Texcoconibacillus texcoconensis]|uniref:Uncharacterized protein n=1 Tax=Texcoconibacillus texcoconensis TaxID=1095777 RepID=A0A840QU26_9BACI|nr:hypothetical protein [Texcoconibacillus texcoconensis]MBB5174767.1 hypothetical protein [Texcoconibacillus texcoconensis]